MFQLIVEYFLHIRMALGPTLQDQCSEQVGRGSWLAEPVPATLQCHRRPHDDYIKQNQLTFIRMVTFRCCSLSFHTIM